MNTEDIRAIESSKVLAIAKDNPILQGVHIETVDYKGRVYDRFYAAKDDLAPGWFVWGMNPEYGDRLRSKVARPDKPARMFPYRNVRMFAGFKTKRDAQVVADALNSK